MIGVDTNVLIRAVLDDTPKEADIAKKFLKIISDKKKLLIIKSELTKAGKPKLAICN